MKAKIMSAILLFSMCLIACKKEEAKPAATPDPILGKWNLVSELTNDYYNGTSHYHTYPFAAGDYMEFRTDGKCIEFQNGQSLTYDYGRVNDTKIWLLIPGNEYELRSMTSASVQLYKKEVYSVTEYHESSLTLTK